MQQRAVASLVKELKDGLTGSRSLTTELLEVIAGHSEFDEIFLLLSFQERKDLISTMFHPPKIVELDELCLPKAGQKRRRGLDERECLAEGDRKRRRRSDAKVGFSSTKPNLGLIVPIQGPSRQLFENSGFHLVFNLLSLPSCYLLELPDKFNNLKSVLISEEDNNRIVKSVVSEIAKLDFSYTELFLYQAFKNKSFFFISKFITDQRLVAVMINLLRENISFQKCFVDYFSWKPTSYCFGDGLRYILTELISELDDRAKLDIILTVHRSITNIIDDSISTYSTIADSTPTVDNPYFNLLDWYHDSQTVDNKRYFFSSSLGSIREMVNLNIEKKLFLANIKNGSFMIEFQDGGRSYAPWPTIFRSVIQYLPSCYTLTTRRKPLVAELKEKIRQGPDCKYSDEYANIINNIIANQWKFSRVQGRSVLFTHKKSNGILVLKVAKRYEQNQLDKQAIMQDFLNRHKSTLNLQSCIPKSIATGFSHDLLIDLKSKFRIWKVGEEEIESFFQLTGNLTGAKYLVYTVDSSDYFVYLHEIKCSERFRTACKKALHDIFVLAQNGIFFVELADLFHNRQENHQDRIDGGRYLTLSELVNDGAFGLGGFCGAHGQGRLNSFTRAVKYTNLRASGLADEKGFVFLEDINSVIGFNPVIKTCKHYNLYQLSSILADVFLIIELCIGTHLKNRGVTNSKDWSKRIEILIDLYSLPIAQATGISQKNVHKKLMLSRDVYSRQMGYFMGGEYIHDFNQTGNNPIKIENLITKMEEELYPGTNVYYHGLKAFREGTWSETKGFSYDGGFDLGPVNGPYPIQEGIRLRYLWAMLTIGIKGLDGLSPESFIN